VSFAKCGHPKTVENVYTNTCGHAVCRTCVRASSSRYKKTEKGRVSGSRYEAGRYARGQARLHAYKRERGCADCGSKKRLEFDHVPERGPKLFNVAQRARRAWSHLRLEIVKCDVVCKPCHVVRSQRRGQFTTNLGGQRV
jgi:hypothetical protein